MSMLGVLGQLHVFWAAFDLHAVYRLFLSLGLHIQAQAAARACRSLRLCWLTDPKLPGSCCVWQNLTPEVLEQRGLGLNIRITVVTAVGLSAQTLDRRLKLMQHCLWWELR